MNPIVTDAVNLWGPALLVCFTVVMGVLYQNSRISDLRTELIDLRTELINLMNAKFDTMTARFDALEAVLKAEVKRLDERIDNATKIVR